MILALLTFLLTLSVLVLVHEFGHFLAAKKAGIKVEEFGFGYPPKIFGKKIGETIYSINWVPFGGFVKLLGEELPSSAKTVGGEGKFWAKPKSTRFLVIIAGVIGNFLLAVVCFSIVYSALGIPTKTESIRVMGTALDSPARLAGIKENDLVLELDAIKLTSSNQFTDLINERKGKEIKLLIGRENDSFLLFLTPRTVPPEGEGSLGVIITDIEIKKYPFWQMPFRGSFQGLKEAFAWTGVVVGGVGKMFGDLLFRGQAPKDVAGPLGIFQMSGQVAKNGVLDVLQFIGVLSVNLAVVNILPLPALDGGRLVFLGYELIARRKPKPAVEHWVNTLGMAFLVGLIILVTINDAVRIFDLGAIISKIRP